ncbi:MAG TPA: ATP-binding protein [Anaerolineae bacterium]|nr:ATP-binding protein [Anaerolineae bacterium]
MTHSIRWRIAVPYVVLVAIATLGLTLVLSHEVRQVRMADLENQLVADARLLADELAPAFGQGASGQALDEQARHWADVLQARVTIIGADGTVLGESHEDRTQMQNHLDRPEIQQALAAAQGTSIRYSASLGYDMMYAVVPVRDPAGGRITGFARVALSLKEIDSGVSRLRTGILLAGLAAALAGGALAVAIAEGTARPLRHLTKAAGRIAEGDLSGRLAVGRRDEVGQLTAAFQNMSEQLQDQMSTLARERGRLAAVLEHMADGVLITDELGNVDLINPAAARLLGATDHKVLGRRLGQVVPHYQILELWKRCHDQGQEQLEAMEISHSGLFLQVIVTPFQVSDARAFLVILQDLTRIRRLETVRRDFMANISHELRTPLAGLKALVDTLRGGALKDPPAAKRFLKRMDGEVDALTQMVEELLELSRIESGQAPLRLGPTPVADVLLPPTEQLRHQAERAGLDLTVVIAPEVPSVLADVERARKVVTNLVHNACKFTPAGGSIVVGAMSAGEEVVISVQDTGVGIPAEDLPRIFERFYKADRARSGGGTGLGLAIAKHIVQGHGGRIWVESVEGQGSTFCFSLPRC